MTSATPISAVGSQRKTIHVTPDPFDEVLLAPERRQGISDWLTENGISNVAVAPVTLEFIPHCTGSLTTCSGNTHGPWWIAFTQIYVNEQGHKEANALTNEVGKLDRTVPMTVEPPEWLVPGWAKEREGLCRCSFCLVHEEAA